MEYVLAALGKCPLTPGGPSGPGFPPACPRSWRLRQLRVSVRHPLGHRLPPVSAPSVTGLRPTVAFRVGAQRAELEGTHPQDRPGRPRPGSPRLLWKRSAPSTKGFSLKIVVVDGGGR